MQTIILITCAIFFTLIILVFSSRTRIKKLYKKYSNQANSSGFNGQQFASIIADKQNLDSLSIKLIDGVMTDAYVPKNKALLMSEAVAFNATISSLAITAHELGHAIQDRQNNRLFGLSIILKKISSFTNKFILPFFFIGILLYVFSNYISLNSSLAKTSIEILLSSGILFAINIMVKITTIPLEYDASKKGLWLLREYNMLNKKELRQAKKLLKVAAHTYITSLFDGIIIFTKKIKIK